MRLISESTDTHAARIKKKNRKSITFNRFASKRVCIEKGRVKTVSSKSPVPSKLEQLVQKHVFLLWPFLLLVYFGADLFSTNFT